MWVDERLSRIMEAIAGEGRVEADSMAATLGVSRETVRRDLMQLERQGRLKRVHGGAVRAEPPPEAPFNARRKVQMDAKREIARTAISLIKPGTSCFIDAGTTTAAFASELASISDLFVITNSIEVAMILQAGPCRNEVVLLGGQVSREVPATHGEMTVLEIGRHRVDIAILSPVGLDPAAGMTYHALSEAAVAQAMLRNAPQLLVLADHTKLGQVSRSVVCPCGKLDFLVSDTAPRQLEPYRRAGIKNLFSCSTTAGTSEH
jgi:DeoR family fructose operon transcriptional repressor